MLGVDAFLQYLKNKSTNKYISKNPIKLKLEDFRGGKGDEKASSWLLGSLTSEMKVIVK